MKNLEPQNYFEAIADATPALIYFMNVIEQKYLYINPAIKRILGYSSDEVMSVGPEFIMSRVHPDDIGRVMQKHLESLALLNKENSDTQDAYTHEDEYRLRHANGEWRWFKSSGVVFERTSDGQIKSILGIAHDITENKEMETRLRISDRMASVGRLAAGVAHEINNPLAHLITRLELAIERLGSAKTEDTKRSLDDACISANRIALIVRDLNTFSRSDDEQLGAIDTHSALDSTITMAMNTIRHKAKLQKEYGEIPYVHANKGRLSQVFLNLLLNAAEAIPEGDVENNHIRVRTRKAENDRVVIEICDTGQGIESEDLKRIFDPFFTSKPPGGGTGLGLTICYSLVKSFDGDIEVETKIGEGTTFRVLLNASNANPFSEKDAERSIEDKVAIRGRILVVDDDQFVADSLVDTLAEHHEVRATYSGQEGLEILLSSDTPFDVVICDLMMPDLNGMDFYESVGRRKPELLERIVFITGGALSDGTERFLRNVTNQVIYKPYRLNSLRALVRTLIENNRKDQIIA